MWSLLNSMCERVIVYLTVYRRSMCDLLKSMYNLSLSLTTQAWTLQWTPRATLIISHHKVAAICGFDATQEWFNNKGKETEDESGTGWTDEVSFWLLFSQNVIRVELT